MSLTAQKTTESELHHYKCFYYKNLKNNWLLQLSTKYLQTLKGKMSIKKPLVLMIIKIYKQHMSEMKWLNFITFPKKFPTDYFNSI